MKTLRTLTFRTTIFACVFITITAAVVFGQQSTPTKHEVWPEIDLFIPFEERFRLFVMSSEERSGEEGEGSKPTSGFISTIFGESVGRSVPVIGTALD